MPTMTIRLSDHEHAMLKQMAEGEGVTLSEFIRSTLGAITAPTYGQKGSQNGDAPAPESIPLIDRQMLVLLHRILGLVVPEDAEELEETRADQQNRVTVLEQGFTGEYWKEVAGFRQELSTHDSLQLMEILDMFRVITNSRKQLNQEGGRLAPDVEYGLTFRGFDGNDPLEGHLADYTKFLLDEGRWDELRDQFEELDRGNSHMPMLGAYRRMLNEYRGIMSTRRPGDLHARFNLSAEELIQIDRASTHPSRRQHPSEDHAEGNATQDD